MRIRGLLFDKDGTLIDYHATWMPLNRAIAEFAAGGDRAMTERILLHCGLDPATGRVKANTPLAVGTSDQIAASFAEVLGEAVPRGLPAEIERIFGAGSTRTSVAVPGLRAALETFARHQCVLGIATHDSLGGIEASLAPLGILPFFEFLAGADSGHGTKPEAGMAAAFCAALGLVPQEICVIGDNQHDLEMGHAAGAALTVGVLTGTSTEEDLRPHADRIYPGLAELAADESFLALLAPAGPR